MVSFRYVAYWLQNTVHLIISPGYKSNIFFYYTSITNFTTSLRT